MVTSSVHVGCALSVALLLMTSLMTSESAATQHDGPDNSAVEALAKALQHYGRPVHLSPDWQGAAANKREAALDVDYGWGGGRFGKRGMADRLGMGGRFGRSVAGSSQSRTGDD